MNDARQARSGGESQGGGGSTWADQSEDRLFNHTRSTVQGCSSQSPQLGALRDEQSPRLYFRNPKLLHQTQGTTVLSPKEYHEISPTNLLLSAAVRLSLPNDVSCSYANSWLWVGSDSPRNSRNPGYRKVQRRTGQRVVELSIPRRKTGEAGYTRCALDGTPSLICSR